MYTRWGDGYQLFKILHDDGALVQSAGRGVILELQRGNQTLGREIEEFLRLLVGIDFVCHRATVTICSVGMNWTYNTRHMSGLI